MFVLWTFRDIARKKLLGPFTDNAAMMTFISEHFNSLMAAALVRDGEVSGASNAYKLEKIEPTLSVTD